MKKIQIINGPNLNLLGRREPEIYGHSGFEVYFEELCTLFPDDNIQYYQSNHEGALIDKIHETGYSVDGIVFNAGAYTHTSIALHDAVKAIDAPVVEVHISNIYAREVFRQKSIISPVCKGIIAGFGLKSYKLAIEALRSM